MRYLNARNFLALYVLAGIACHDEDAGDNRCKGSAEDSLGGGDQPRRVEVQCYVAPIVDGKPDCLPASDPTVVTKTADANHSTGFLGEFAIAADDSQPLPEVCDALAECCATLAQWKQVGCFDAIDDPARRSSDCRANSYAYECSSVQPSGSDDDAGTQGDSEAFSLCCYQICGHTHST